MAYKTLLFLVFILAILCAPVSVFCENVDDTPSSESGKTLNNIIIDTEKKEIRIKCRLAITAGILEFFLVDEAGNTYESVFKVTENKPSELHFALLLLGFEPVSFNTYYELLDKEGVLSELQKKKCLLQCTILNKNKEIPISDIINCREKDKGEELIWVFTGASFDKNNKYTADYTYSYISIWPMPESVINLLSSAGNPYRGEFGYEMVREITFSLKEDFIIVLKEWKNEK